LAYTKRPNCSEFQLRCLSRGRLIGLKEGGHSPRAITGIEKLAFDLAGRLEDLRDRIEAIRTGKEDGPEAPAALG
jgi:hypothetical protein